MTTNIVEVLGLTYDFRSRDKFNDAEEMLN